MSGDPSAMWAAYQVCKVRGHTPSGFVATSNPPWNSCKFCGTYYRFTKPELVEMYVPEETVREGSA